MGDAIVTMLMICGYALAIVAVGCLVGRLLRRRGDQYPPSDVSHARAGLRTGGWDEQR